VARPTAKKRKRACGNSGNGHSPQRETNYAKRTARRKALFLAALREHGSVKIAAKAAHVATKYPYQWRGQDPEFNRAWIEATEYMVDHVEQTLYEIATKGIKRDIRWHGKVVASYQDFSDSTKAGLALLRARRPEVFAEGWPRKARAPEIRRADAFARSRSRRRARRHGATTTRCGPRLSRR
jgi:hypothetical protein